tara:strand:- start:348 stop:1157 length:810 start_codon:yes stop_codon:yes gene_type:complete
MTKEKELKLLEQISKTAQLAGKEILEVYNTEFDVETKSDQSPLTSADRAAHEVIVEGLSASGIPILSEEGKDIPFIERMNWELFWMVDPLDGTKEFIKRNGEFTVNIALIENNQPILGVVYVPVKDTIYLGGQSVGAYKIETFSEVISRQFQDHFNDLNRLPKKIDRPYTLVGSRSHMSEETEEFFNQVRALKGEVEIISVGSSLKLCMVAEGRADEYPRFAPTMEWDTAAGHAVVSAMGGKVINWKLNSSLAYNKENLLNDWFLVKAN